MLVLTRPRGTWIEVGPPGGPIVKVKILRVRPDGSVMVGVEAPRDQQIRRGPDHPGTSDLVQGGDGEKGSVGDAEGDV